MYMMYRTYFKVFKSLIKDILFYVFSQIKLNKSNL